MCSPTSCTCLTPDASSSPAGKNWRLSSKRKATDGCRALRLPSAADMATLLESTANPFVQTYSDVEKTLPGRDLGWLAELRRDAIHRFSELGVPTLKQEAWRFTPVEAIAKTVFQ